MSKVVFTTNGKGLWSDRKQRAVEIVDMQLGRATLWEDDTEKDMFGELRVQFNENTWNTRVDGLIYTDRGWITDLRKFLNSHGLPGADVSYSEQGMQGDDYVSLDAGHKFYAAWMQKFNIPLEQMVDRF
jgi:hypothetical protein